MGKWKFEVVQIRARKVDTFGDPYDAVATITIVDGQPHVEGLLSKDGSFNREDYIELQAYLKSIGYNTYTTSMFVGGKRIITVTRI